MVKNLKRLKKQTERELGKAEGQRSVCMTHLFGSGIPVLVF